MIAAQCFHNICSKFITCNTYTLIANNTSQRNNSNTCCTAANINNHISNRFFYINANTKCGSHWFMYQINFFCTCLFSTVAYCTFFNFSNA